MVISKTVCRDCGKAITHNTDVAHYRLHLRTPFPFDFEFFVVAIPLNVRGIILVTNNSFATNLRKPKKNHRANNTWRNTAVITVSGSPEPY